jgi:hypothetical protein
VSIIGHVVKFVRNGDVGVGIATSDIDVDAEIEVRITTAPASNYPVGSETYVTSYEVISINPPGDETVTIEYKQPGFTVVIQSQPIRTFDSEQFARIFAEGAKAAFKDAGLFVKVYIDRVVNERTEVE